MSELVEKEEVMNGSKITENFNLSDGGNDNQPEPKMELDLSTDNLTTVFTDPINYNIKHPLESKWTLWYDSQAKKTSQKQWTQNLNPVVTFDTVEDFWGTYNNVNVASQLSTNSNFHLFREGIRPAWEDKNNENGGRWTFQVNIGKDVLSIDNYWLYSLLYCIGEASPYPEEICGVVVSARKSFFRLSLWTRSTDNSDKLLALGQKFRASIDLNTKYVMEFQPHSDAGKSADRNNRLQL